MKNDVPEFAQLTTQLNGSKLLYRESGRNVKALIQIEFLSVII